MSPKKDPEPISRKTREDDDEDVAISRTTLRDQILAALKARGGPEASGFLEQLNQDNLDVMSQKVTLQVPFNVRDGFLEKSMTTWVDKMFDHFNNYVYEFNPAVRGTELEITFSRPEIVTEQVISNRYRDPDKIVNMFVGRLATRAWTLVVRGQKEKIEAFIVPGERVIGLTRTQTTYRPYLALDGMFSTGKVFWKQNEQFVKIEKLEELTRELFTALIRFARGELTEDHVLASGNAEVPLMEPEPTETQEKPTAAEHRRSEFEEQFFKDAAAEAESRRHAEEEAARRLQSQSGRFKAAGRKDTPPEAPAKESPRVSKEEPAPPKVQKSTGGQSKLSNIQTAGSTSVGTGQVAPKPPEERTAPGSAPPPAAQNKQPPVAEPAQPAGQQPQAIKPAQEPPAPPAPSPSVSQVPPASVGPPETHQHQAPPHVAHREPHVDHHHHHPGTGEHQSPPVAQPTQTSPPTQAAQPAGQASPQATTPGSDKAMLETEATNVTLACDILLKSVDNELEAVTRSGAEAFKSMDLEKVQKSMKQTLKLKAFREKVLTLLSDWSAVNTDD